MTFNLYAPRYTLHELDHKGRIGRQITQASWRDIRDAFDAANHIYHHISGHIGVVERIHQAGAPDTVRIVLKP